MRSRIKVKSLNFMRGRTFINKYLIIDEAQNLTPKQMKTLITRAGPGTKVVCLGNIAQIDTPYLTEGSSGLTYVVEGSFRHQDDVGGSGVDRHPVRERARAHVESASEGDGAERVVDLDAGRIAKGPQRFQHVAGTAAELDEPQPA